MSSSRPFLVKHGPFTKMLFRSSIRQFMKSVDEDSTRRRWWFLMRKPGQLLSDSAIRQLWLRYNNGRKRLNKVGFSLRKCSVMSLCSVRRVCPFCHTKAVRSQWKRLEPFAWNKMVVLTTDSLVTVDALYSERKELISLAKEEMDEVLYARTGADFVSDNREGYTRISHSIIGISGDTLIPDQCRDHKGRNSFISVNLYPFGALHEAVYGNAEIAAEVFKVCRELPRAAFLGSAYNVK